MCLGFACFYSFSEEKGMGSTYTDNFILVFILLPFLIGDLFTLGKLRWFLISGIIVFSWGIAIGPIRYLFEIDFFGLAFVSLTVLITIFIFEALIGDHKLNYRVGGSISLGIMIVLFLVFFSIDLFLFYFFFEFVVVPIFLIVILVGRSVERLQSSLYLFLYTLVSSMPFLIFTLQYFNAGNCLILFSGSTGIAMAGFWWNFIRLVFLVKLPVFIIHLWLPKAHVEAPLVGSMILAGVLLKLGGYGLYRVFTLFESDCLSAGWFYISIGLYGGLIMSLVCLSQVDIKSLIAYSSIVHIGPVLSGLIRLSWVGLIGGFLIMLSHGIRSSGMFYLINLAYERLGSRSVLVLRGLNSFVPVMTFLVFILVARNISVPPSFNFYSEIIFMISLLDIRVVIKLILGTIFLLVGVYNVFFYVSLNHRERALLIFSFTESSEKELKILSYHSLPIYLFIFFLFLWCLYSL